MTDQSDSMDKPCFELRQVYVDGGEKARICTLKEFLKASSKIHMGRRKFIALSGLTTLATLVACESSSEPEQVVEKSPELESTRVEPVSPEANREEPEQVVVEQEPVTDGITCADIRAHRDAIVNLAFSPDGKLLASTSTDRTAKLWNLINSEMSALLIEHTDTTSSPTFSPNGETLAWVQRPNEVVLYDLGAGKIIDRLVDHEKSVWLVSFSPDGSKLAISGDGLLELWDVASLRLLWNATEVSDITSQDFTPDGQWLFTGNVDGFIQQWDVESGLVENAIDGENGEVLGVRVSPDGSLLVWGGTESNLTRIWDIASGELVYFFNAPAVISIVHAFSPEGKWIAAAGPNNTISIHDVATGFHMYYLEVPGNVVRDLAFSPDGKLLAAGDDLGTIAFWDTLTFQYEPQPADYCLFDPDSTSADSQANAYRLTDENGITRTYTLPCGAPIPAGAVCTCNCVPGVYAGPLPSSDQSGPSTSPGGKTCNCDEVCTCVPVCICMAV